MEATQGEEYLSRLEQREFPRARLGQDLDAVGMEEIALGGLQQRFERRSNRGLILGKRLFGDRREGYRPQ